MSVESLARIVELPRNPAKPVQCLTTDEAMLKWHRSAGFAGFNGWLKRRCERIKGRYIIDGDIGDSAMVSLFLNWLDRLERCSCEE